MNRNVIIILVGGFLVAMMVALLMQSMLGKTKKSETVDTQRVEILVAAKNLSVGKELKEGDFTWKEWPEDSAFMGAIIRDGEQPAHEAAYGKLLRSLSEGQPMHMSLLVEDNKGDFLSANVAKGMRAVGISVKSCLLYTSPSPRDRG